MEDQEIYYGIGTIINDPEDWTKFAETFNKAIASEDVEPLETEWTGETEKLPGFVAIGKTTRKELEESAKNNVQMPIWKDIEEMLELIDADYPICMFKL